MAQQRLHRLRSKRWDLQREFSFALDPMSDGCFSPDNTKIIDLDSDKGYYLTAELDTTAALVIVKSFVSWQQVLTTVPREGLNGIYANGGKSQLVYGRDRN